MKYKNLCVRIYEPLFIFLFLLLNITGEITDETDAMPAVFPVRSGTSIGGMGILSMGRSTVMRKTPSSKSITIGEDKDAKLVKKTVNYANNSSTRKSGLKQNRNSSIANTSRMTDTENNSRKNWQQRCALPGVHDSPLGYCAVKTTYSRERDGILERVGDFNLPYGSIPNEDLNDQIELNTMKSSNISQRTTEESEDGEGDSDAIKDAWTSGSEGYRIIKNTSHLNFDDITIEEQMTNFRGGKIEDEKGEKTFVTF
jgi:hypothetical protein